MALIDKLKQIILDNAKEIHCPRKYDLPWFYVCQDLASQEECRQCWAYAIDKAEQKEAMSNESD